MVGCALGGWPNALALPDANSPAVRSPGRWWRDRRAEIVKPSRGPLLLKGQMMDDAYYVISNSDGDTTVKKFTKDELEAWLQENYIDEEVGLYALQGPMATTSSMTNEYGHTNYWPDQSVLIIRGSVVIPEIVNVTTRYSVGDD